MGYFVGLDIGGTHVRISLFSVESKEIIDYYVRTFIKEDYSDSEVQSNICEIIEERFRENIIGINELKGIGISIAANYDRKSERISYWPNNPKWNGFPLKEYLYRYFQVPIVIEDDANCAALGEYLLVQTKKDNLIYCSVGTGIGMGIIINGSIYHGDNNMAGDLGHVRIMAEDRKCVCGKTGCLQTVLQRKSNTENEPKYFEKSIDNLALQLGYQLYQMAYLLDISTIILGGGLIEYNSQFFAELKESFTKYAEDRLNLYSFEKSNLYNKNGIYGILKLLTDTIKCT